MDRFPWIAASISGAFGCRKSGLFDLVDAQGLSEKR
jgi:hypothetical protein